jgi:hypothetical protein
VTSVVVPGWGARGKASERCRSSDADMIQTALGANGDDYLSFDFAPDGHCRTVFVDKSSMHGPKY